MLDRLRLLDPSVPGASFAHNVLHSIEIDTSLPPPPAKLVLVMFARQNAATKLERNLPLWVRLVDYAVIGVDSASSDSSWNAVSRALHPIPHHIQEVEGFEETGYGEALTPLVEKAFALFPDADAVRSHPLSSGDILVVSLRRFFARVLVFVCCASLPFRGCSAAVPLRHRGF